MLTPFNLVLLIVAMQFFLGMGTFVAGVLIVAFRASSNDVKTLALQTSRLVQKGVAEDVAGLVGNATELMDTMNQLVRTTKGVGIFLMLMGLLLMGLASWFALQIYKLKS